MEEGYDLALRGGVLADSSLIARRLMAGRNVICAAPGYLRQRGRPLTPQELKEHDCLLHSGGGPRTALQFSGTRGIATVTLHARFSANNLNVIRDAAEAGLGIAVLPNTSCERALAEGTLEELLTDWSLPEGGLYAVYPSPRHLTPKVRAFLDFLDERVKSTHPL